MWACADAVKGHTATTRIKVEILSYIFHTLRAIYVSIFCIYNIHIIGFIIGLLRAGICRYICACARGHVNVRCIAHHWHMEPHNLHYNIVSVACIFISRRAKYLCTYLAWILFYESRQFTYTSICTSTYTYAMRCVQSRKLK